MKEILLAVLTTSLVIIFFGTIIGVYIYKKIYHLPTGECACCHKSTQKMLEQYHKMYSEK